MGEINTTSALDKAVIGGDLSNLSDADKLTFYNKVCESIGLNPLTKPLEFIRLNGKLVLYARKDATEQLRKINGISIKIMAREKVDDLYVVTAQAIDRHGRTDESIGAISLKGLMGEAAANAIMKAETKAKRRVTLSVSGLGFLDESEVSAIAGAKPLDFDVSTGKVRDDREKAPRISHQAEDMRIALLEFHTNQSEVGNETALELWLGLDEGLKREVWGCLSTAERFWLKSLKA